MKTIRIQTGHYGRTSGSTGAYNPDLNLREADMNHWLSEKIRLLVSAVDVDGFEWEFVGPDDRLSTDCDMFLSLHMDGNDDPNVQGPSMGYPPDSVESAQWAEQFKARRLEIEGANRWRRDNYTTNLSRYYAWHSSYSGTAEVKCLIENGFVTNNSEAYWATNNRTQVALAIIETVLDWYEPVPPIEPPEEPPTEPPPPIEEQIARLTIENERQTKQIVRLQRELGHVKKRVTKLETNQD